MKLVKPGRKSAQDLAIKSPIAVIPRLKPPRTLSPLEARLWSGAVDALPAGFFGPEHVQQLDAWVRHSALAEMLAERLVELDPTDAAWPKLCAAQVAHSKAALAYARSLRLTVNSRADRDATATAAKKGRTGPASLEQLAARYADEG